MTNNLSIDHDWVRVSNDHHDGSSEQAQYARNVRDETGGVIGRIVRNHGVDFVAQLYHVRANHFADLGHFGSFDDAWCTLLSLGTE